MLENNVTTTTTATTTTATTTTTVINHLVYQDISILLYQIPAELAYIRLILR